MPVLCCAHLLCSIVYICPPLCLGLVYFWLWVEIKWSLVSRWTSTFGSPRGVNNSTVRQLLLVADPYACLRKKKEIVIHLRRSTPLIDCHQIWRVESYCGRYQLCQILGQWLQGFRLCRVKIRHYPLTGDVAVNTVLRLPRCLWCYDWQFLGSALDVPRRFFCKCWFYLSYGYLPLQSVHGFFSFYARKNGSQRVYWAHFVRLRNSPQPHTDFLYVNVSKDASAQGCAFLGYEIKSRYLQYIWC